MKTKRTLPALLMFAAGILLVAAPIVQANGIQTLLYWGRAWTSPENDGDASSAIMWPAGYPEDGKFGDAFSGDYPRSWLKPHEKGGTYLWTTDWTDPLGTTYPHAGSYMFRSMNYDYPEKYLTEGNNWDYLYPLDLQETFRYERPMIYVITQDTTIDFVRDTGEDYAGGLLGYKYPSSSGKGPHPTPIVDANLVTEAQLFTSWRYIQGVDLERTTRVWQYGTPHQDYIIHDKVLTNTGYSGRKLDEWPTPQEAPPFLENQTITGMVWARSHDWRSKYATQSAQQGQDEESMYVQPWGNPGYHAALVYDDDHPDIAGPDWGDPTQNEAYLNLLGGSAFVLYGPLFVSVGPGEFYDVGDLSQPGFRTVWYERGFDMQGSAPYVAVGDVVAQRELMCDGSIHLDTDVSFRDHPATAAVYDNVRGPTSVIGFGPVNGDRSPENIAAHGWTLAFGESVHIVNMWAASGVDAETAREQIGAPYNARRLASEPEASWQTQAEIDLYMTGLDSVNKAAALAYWNYNGEFAANVSADDLARWGLSDHVTMKPAEYDEPYNAPDPPRAPGFIATYARAEGDGGGIIVRWGTEAETTPNADTGLLDVVGYRVYRTAGSRLAAPELICDAPVNYFAEQAASEHFGVAVPGGKYFIDDAVVAGTDYWYSVVAYDDGSSNWAQPGKSLESARFQTWTNFSNIGVTALAAGNTTAVGAPAKFSLAQNAPNPFNPSTTIRFSVDAPGAVSLNVYNTAGQLVRTLVDKTMDANAMHEVVWDGTDNTGHSVGSGVYVYRLVSGEKQLQKRMVLVR